MSKKESRYRIFENKNKFMVYKTYWKFSIFEMKYVERMQICMLGMYQSAIFSNLRSAQLWIEMQERLIKEHLIK